MALLSVAVKRARLGPPYIYGDGSPPHFAIVMLLNTLLILITALRRLLVWLVPDSDEQWQGSVSQEWRKDRGNGRTRTPKSPRFDSKSTISSKRPAHPIRSSVTYPAGWKGPGRGCPVDPNGNLRTLRPHALETARLWCTVFRICRPD
ncbi:hypothetical protein BP5796_02150 [Coleophoma crateriformis]|uniref:Uncharacterized protein n=1 Tax=Coleophoma crateriformis TaxID=565419 RepID=A0A3D8SXE6_9HELO|nr:hypothetical protein BP5796_02150 [Coleophoma crateriformis]